MNFTTDLPKKEPIVSYIVASAVKCEKFYPGSAKEGPVFRMHAVILKRKADGSLPVDPQLSKLASTGGAAAKPLKGTWPSSINAGGYILCHVRKVAKVASDDDEPASEPAGEPAQVSQSAQVEDRQGSKKAGESDQNYKVKNKTGPHKGSSQLVQTLRKQHSEMTPVLKRRSLNHRQSHKRQILSKLSPEGGPSDADGEDDLSSEYEVKNKLNKPRKRTLKILRKNVSKRYYEVSSSSDRLEHSDCSSDIKMTPMKRRVPYEGLEEDAECFASFMNTARRQQRAESLDLCMERQSSI